MAKFVTLHAILQKLVEAARNKPETTGKLVTFILKNEKKLKPLVKASAGAATDLIAATEVLKKVNDVTGDNMNKVDKFVFDNASKAISILQDATSITNLLTGGKTKSGAGKVFRQIEKFVNPGQIMLEQMKGKINMANNIRNKLFGPNDLSWYGHYPELNQAMIGPNFYNIVGTPLNLTYEGFKYSVPLGLTLDIALTIPTKVDRLQLSDAGPQKADSSSFKVAINKIYASIRRANSGAINYTPRDLMIFILNFRSLVAEYVQWGRLYGTIIKYKIVNRTVPSLFFRMIGVPENNEQEYINQAANIYNKLTQWRLRLNSLCPIDLDIFKRTEWLFTGYWKDDSSSKAQYFAFKSVKLPKYVSKEADGIAWTNYAMENGFNNTYNDAVMHMEQDIANFADNPTSVIIAGDMLKAFADAGLKQYILPRYTMDYEAPESYDEEALTIIQNSSTFPASNPTVRLFWQNYDKGDLVSQVYQTNVGNEPVGLKFKNDQALLSRYINAYKGVKSKVHDNRMTLALTRFATNYYAYGSTKSVTLSAIDIGTEVVVIDHFYYMDQYRDIKDLAYHDYRYIDATEDPSSYFMLMFNWAGVDWAPMLRPAINLAVAEHTTLLVPMPLWDWEMYAEVTTEQLGTFNDIVAMNLLYTPDVIKPNKVDVMFHIGESSTVTKSNKKRNKQNKAPKENKDNS